MRLLLATLLTTSFAFLPGTLQDGGDEPDTDKLPPFTRYRIERRAELEEKIESAWTLVEFRQVDVPVDQRNVQGFAMFQDGFMTITLMARRVVDGFLGAQTQYGVQGGAYRYRISEQLKLQVSTVHGFTNLNAENAMGLERVGNAREYRIDLKNDTLTLERVDGSRFIFRRTTAGEFPESAIEKLRRGVR